MKRKKLLAGALACCLCLGGVVSSVKAVNEPDGMLDAELYAQYYRAINKYEAEGHTIYYIDSELIDLNNDQIPELLFIYEDSLANDAYACYTIEVHQYIRGSEQANCVYKREGGFSNQPTAEIELGSYNGKSAIRVHCEEWIGQPYEFYDLITFDENLSYYEENQHKFEPHPVWSDIPGGYGESEEAFNKLRDNFKSSKVLATAGERFQTASNPNGLYEWELKNEFLGQLQSLYWESRIETLKQQVETSSISLTDALDTLSESDRIEMQDFMQAYNDCIYDGSPMEAEDTYIGLYSILKIISSGDETIYDSEYYSSHYEYEPIEFSIYNGKSQGGSRMALSEFDQLCKDLYGAPLLHEDLFPLKNDPIYRIEFDESNATVYHETETEFLPIENMYSNLELFYQITDNLYYAIFRVEPFFSGGDMDAGMSKAFGTALLGKFSRDGQTYWRCFYANQNSTLIPDEVLKRCMLASSPDSNITFDYTKYSDFTSFEQYMAELETQLDTIDNKPNAKALSEITDYINFSLQNCTAKGISGKNNHFTINEKGLQGMIPTLRDEAQAVDQVLNSRNIQLNQPYEKTVRLDAAADWETDAVQVTLSSDVSVAMDGADRLTVYLGDNRHAISITSEALELLSDYTIQLQQGEDAAYTISYVDASGAEISYLSVPVTVTLPAENELASVLLTYANGSENWGGQYDAVNQTLSFDAPYTGEYTVLNKEITLSDIDSLSEESQQAIRFMVSKGYLSAPDGKFNPSCTLTRYDFSEALVRMFYAQQDGLTTTFTDVPKDSLYYPYIASGETKGIIHGYDDVTFRGDSEVLNEEVIALCSRTLMEKKSFRAPEKPEDYLHFVDTTQIPDWAKQEIAFAVREGLIDDGGILQPAFAINRADAALILYRLFMKLYETPPVQIELAPEAEKTGLPIAVPVAVIGLAAVTCSGFIFMRKRKKVE